jgi:hypothetical protein
LLAARQLIGPAVEERFDRQNPRRATDGSRDLRVRHAAVLQPEGQVVAHTHVLIERVILEYHRNVAVLRLKVVHDPPADGDGAAADLLEAGDHAQRRRFAATRWAYQHDELAISDGKIDVLDRDHAAVNLVHISEHDVGHYVRSSARE